MTGPARALSAMQPGSVLGLECDRSTSGTCSATVAVRDEWISASPGPQLEAAFFSRLVGGHRSQDLILHQLGSPSSSSPSVSSTSFLDAGVDALALVGLGGRGSQRSPLVGQGDLPADVAAARRSPGPGIAGRWSFARAGAHASGCARRGRGRATITTLADAVQDISGYLSRGAALDDRPRWWPASDQHDHALVHVPRRPRRPSPFPSSSWPTSSVRSAVRFPCRLRRARSGHGGDAHQSIATTTRSPPSCSARRSTADPTDRRRGRLRDPRRSSRPYPSASIRAARLSTWSPRLSIRRRGL